MFRVIYFLFLFFVTCSAMKTKKNKYLCDIPLSCGNIQNISYPFGLKGGPENCGNPKYFLDCENNQTILHWRSGKYLVQEINRQKKTIRIVDSGLQPNNCSSLPLYPPAYVYMYEDEYSPYYVVSQERIMFMSCENPVNFSRYVVETAPCLSGVNGSKYALFGVEKLSEIPDMCTVDWEAMVSLINCRMNNCSYLDIYEEMLNGFELSWTNIQCEQCKGSDNCIFNDDYSKLLGCSDGFLISYYWLIIIIRGLILLSMAVGARCFLGTPCVIAILTYKWRRRHLSMYDKVEDFLRSQNNLMPIVYSYSEIKKMTSGLKVKLGEGGYGSVYKGKLSSGRIVAVKILSKPKANGQDFINEVSTIGRIHHVNVVQLIGFCAERSKRALLYDFMPNGSLEKYIFSQNVDVALSFEQMYQISLGVARGIEYLHRGCDMHFDIKPHNILLDENFDPKVSDFGLAKLYRTSDMVVSLTAVRGTIGYMAPELFYKNIGAVSFKADVYSFGMLLMEMAGERKNNAVAKSSSQTYFPFCVYDQVAVGKEIEIEDATDDEKKLVKKMVIVALWCIQFNPRNRPSMNEVVKMLQGELESIQLPPRLFLYPEETLVNDGGNETSCSSGSMGYTESISLIASES